MPDDKCKRCNDKGYLQADSVYCPDCNGHGIGPYHPTDTVKCKTCGGLGKVAVNEFGQKPQRFANSVNGVEHIHNCPECSDGRCYGGAGPIGAGVCETPTKTEAPPAVSEPTPCVKVPPPEGYATWLDYAADIVPCEDFVAVHAELSELRANADKWDRATTLLNEQHKKNVRLVDEFLKKERPFNA